MRYLRQLAEIGRGDIAGAGGKGANLGELVRAGLPVPPGFVLTTDAYRAYVAATGIDERVRSGEGRIRDLFTAPVPDDIAGELLAARKELGAAVAVRSSATAAPSSLRAASSSSAMSSGIGAVKRSRMRPPPARISSPMPVAAT